MHKIVVLLASLVAAAALVTVVGSASAADKPTLGDAVAARLGISGDQLRAAFKAELTARIDAAAAAGRLTPEQAARLKAKIASANGLGVGIRKAFVQKHKALVGRIAKAKSKGPAATYLEMSRAELVTQLRSGKSLAQIAQAKGKSVDGLVAAIVAPAKELASKAVANGRLTKQRADELIAKLTDRVERLVQRAPAKAS